jgi:hypothetical protein
MPILSKPSGAARTAVMYITAGALIDVWSIIYWAYLNHHAPEHGDAPYYWVYGFFLTGVVLLVIGLALGRIGRAARHAELPPELPDGQTAEPPANAVPPGAPAPGPVPVYYTAPVQGAPAAAVPVVPAAPAAPVATRLPR